MFLADPSVMDRLQRLEETITAFRVKFKTRLGSKKLLPEAKALVSQYDELVAIMPKEAIFSPQARRHLGFLVHYLERNQRPEHGVRPWGVGEVAGLRVSPPRFELRLKTAAGRRS